MRAHGVPNFPDPNQQGSSFTFDHVNGVYSVNGVNGIDPNAPAYQSADQTCHPLLGSGPSPQQLQQDMQKQVQFSACMRANGIPDFPDPAIVDGQAQINLHIQPGSDLNPHNAQFQAAQKACSAYGIGFGTGSSSGGQKRRFGSSTLLPVTVLKPPGSYNESADFRANEASRERQP